MKIYQVGGSIRDALLGLPVSDLDYVVVGGTPAEMIAEGYTQVGAAFPVFLHPITRDEYALARTERKSGVGYKGFTVEFSPTVTLEEDLIRRDLTINSMARDIDTGEIFDPWGGQADLANKIIRHTSPAFAEDPVRVLRACRFAARFGFTIAPETRELMRVVAPELSAVSPARIYHELFKGITGPAPHVMVHELLASHALETAILHPIKFAHSHAWDHRCVKLSVHGRMACLLYGFSEADYAMHHIPTEYQRFTSSLWEWGAFTAHYNDLDAATRHQAIMGLRALNNDHWVDVCAQAALIYDVVNSATIIQRDIDRIKDVDMRAHISTKPAGVSTSEWVTIAQIAAIS